MSNDTNNYKIYKEPNSPMCKKEDESLWEDIKDEMEQDQEEDEEEIAVYVNDEEISLFCEPCREMFIDKSYISNKDICDICNSYLIASNGIEEELKS